MFRDDREHQTISAVAFPIRDRCRAVIQYTQVHIRLDEIRFLHW